MRWIVAIRDATDTQNAKRHEDKNRTISVSKADTTAKAQFYDYVFAKTPINGRRDGVFERKSLTKPFSVRIST